MPALAPLGALYLGASQMHHALYDRGWRRSRRVEAPVVAIGNLTVGGTGKTPTAIWLARELASRGHAVGIVSRGYGAPDRKSSEEPLVVAHCGEIFAGPSSAGDEPVLIAREAPAHAVVVGADRVAAAQRAIELGSRVLLLDDGFQHRPLARDLNLLLLDAARPFGNGLGLPAGPLREPPSAARRADLVMLTRAGDDLLEVDGPLPRETLPPPLRPLLECPVVASGTRPTALRDPGGGSSPPQRLAGRRVLAVSGLARPEAFEDTIRGLGGILTDHVTFEDHHPYNASDIGMLESRRHASGAELLLTTTKDAVRWPATASRPHVLEVGVHVPAGDVVIGWVLRAIGRHSDG